MRLHRSVLAFASRLVPKSLRAEWRAEWDAELQYRESSLRKWNRRDWRSRLDLVQRSAGAVWDALWLQSSHWHSLRLFGRHWRLTLTAVLSLGVGIAAIVVGFATSNALLFRPPGVADPSSLLTIHVRTHVGSVRAALLRRVHLLPHARSGVFGPRGLSALRVDNDDP